MSYHGNCHNLVNQLDVNKTGKKGNKKYLQDGIPGQVSLELSLPLHKKLHEGACCWLRTPEKADTTQGRGKLCVASIGLVCPFENPLSWSLPRPPMTAGKWEPLSWVCFSNSPLSYLNHSEGFTAPFKPPVGSAYPERMSSEKADKESRPGAKETLTSRTLSSLSESESALEQDPGLSVGFFFFGGGGCCILGIWKFPG